MSNWRTGRAFTLSQSYKSNQQLRKRNSETSNTLLVIQSSSLSLNLKHILFLLSFLAIMMIGAKEFCWLLNTMQS